MSDPVKQGEGSVGSFITYKVTTVVGRVATRCLLRGVVASCPASRCVALRRPASRCVALLQRVLLRIDPLC